jgi:hypothetical protein
MKKRTTDPNLEGIKSLVASMRNLKHQAALDQKGKWSLVLVAKDTEQSVIGWIKTK